MASIPHKLFDPHNCHLALHLTRNQPFHESCALNGNGTYSRLKLIYLYNIDGYYPAGTEFHI